jgi:hypothetical protein
MFKKLIAAVLLSITTVSPVSAFDANDGQFYYRYKTAASTSAENPDSDSKAITAFYVGATESPFSEKLPMKAEWQLDSWSVQPGSALPEGITFDPETLTFSGTPTEIVQGRVVKLAGYDKTGAFIAKATATFDIYKLPAQRAQVSLYGHTNQYFIKSIPLPAGVVVDSWKQVYPAPVGINVNGRNFDGTPTQASSNRVLNLGYAYNDKDKVDPIFAIFGDFLVEDKPSFPFIADKLSTFDPHWGPLWVDFGVTPINNSLLDINGKSAVSYVLQVENNAALPGTLQATGNTTNLRVKGNITKHYDQARVRYHAIDRDDTEAYSNWFTVGSLGPVPKCGSYGDPSDMDIVGFAGTPLPTYPIPSMNSAGTRTYTLTNGTLPSGISLNGAGAFVGTPTKEEIQENIKVRVDVLNNGNTDTTECGPYRFDIGPAQLKVSASVNAAHLRVGDTVTGKVTPTTNNFINPYTITLDDPASLPSTVTYNAASFEFGGKVNAPGTYNPSFTFTNGDGGKVQARASFTVHEDLKIDPVAPIVEIKQYDAEQELLVPTWDADAVIAPGQARLKVKGSLPGFVDAARALSMDVATGVISGGTSNPPNTYGPYKVRLSDATGDEALSNDFFVKVLPRDNIVATTSGNVDFYINAENPGVAPVTFVQPPLADVLTVTYTLSGPALPDGLRFDTATGQISGEPTQQNASTYSGYTVTADDTDGGHVVSDPFTISVMEPPLPDANDLADITVNVSGATATSVVTKPVNFSGFEKTLVGGVGGVAFTGYEPQLAGFNFQNGILQGTPQVEFEGPVKVLFKDAAGRVGDAAFNLKILPYPALTYGSSSYDIPRLSNAQNRDIRPTKNSGFYGTVTFKLSPMSRALPTGFSIDAATGRITGRTQDVEQTFNNIIIQATDTHDGTSITVDSDPISIRLVEQTDLSLKVTPTKVNYYLLEGDLSYVSSDSRTLTPGGSYVAPLTYSLVNAPTGLGINPTSGQITGSPSALGEWTVTINVVDKEGSTASADLTVKATKSGLISVASDGTFTARLGETYETPNITSTNVVGTVKLTDEGRPSTMTFDPLTGVFRGYWSAAGRQWLAVKATDDDQRGSNMLVHWTDVIGPLDLQLTQTQFSAKQYAAAASDRIAIQFPAAINAMGSVGYGIVGQVPGVLFYKTYPNDDVSQSPATWTHYAENGAPWVVTNAAALPLDAIVFDTVKLTLEGTPSQDGVFDLKFAAYDDHSASYLNPADATREAYNSAYADFRITVAKALDLVASNSANSETVPLYTKQPTIKTSIANAAYGIAPTWVKVSNDIPSTVGLSPDTSSSVADTHSLAYGGYALTKGTFGNAIYRVTDAAGRSVVTPRVDFTVVDRAALSVSMPLNPQFLLVNVSNANIKVTAKNAAFEATIPAANWSVTGVNLPPGITYVIEDGGVRFTGVATVLGTYTGTTVTATDARGATASTVLTFKVGSSTDPIVLNVANITTKVGMPVAMISPYATAPLSTSNTYGALRFSSSDIGAHPGLQISPTTGELSGNLSAAQSFTLSISVTDETNRITGKTINVDVIPNLRIIVASQVSVTQGTAASIATATDYNIGAVTYSKGAGDWPAGLTVNATTGKLEGTPTAESKTYAGLTIVGTDASGDTQPSNAFSVIVQDTLAKPVITTPATMMPYATVGTAAVSFTPVVKDSVKSLAWTYGGTVYSLNKPLAADTGLTFDPTTGTISGTPTKAVIYDDLKITVTSKRGDASTTAAFRFGVQPSGPVVASAANTTAYKIRALSPFTADAPLFDNTFGTLTYTVTGNAGIAYSTTTGVVSGTPTATAAGANGTSYTTSVTVKDGFNRTANFTYSLRINPALTAVATSTAAFAGDAYTLTPTVTGKIGTLTYSYSGLPDSIAADAAGKLSGVYPAAPSGTAVWNVILTVTDSDDGKTATAPFTITSKPTAYRFWKFVVSGNKNHPDMTELYPADNAHVGWASDIVTGTPSTMFDGSTSTGSVSLNNRAGTATVEYNTPHNVTTVGIARAPVISTTAITVYYSEDGISWTQYWYWTANTSYQQVTWTGR